MPPGEDQTSWCNVFGWLCVSRGVHRNTNVDDLLKPTEYAGSGPASPIAGRVGPSVTKPNDPVEVIYRRDYRRLVALAILLVDDRDTAEEIVQDAFLALHRSMGAVVNPEGFLRRCVVNGGRDVQRRRSVRRMNLPPVRGPSQFRFAELDDVLARLPFRQRAALVLRYVEDLPEPEIAQVLGVRPTTVRTLVRRGLAQMRREIEK